MAVDVAGAATGTVPVDRVATPRFLACARVRADTAEALLRLCVKMGACVVDLYYELAIPCLVNEFATRTLNAKGHSRVTLSLR